MKIGPVGQFLIIGAAVGILAPFILSLCLFGAPLQMFLAAPQPTPGYWSGAPTAAPTPIPSAVKVWTNSALTSTGGAVFVLWSVVGAFVGEAVAVRRWGKDWDATRKAWLGAVVGSILFNGIAVCGLLP